MPDASQLSLFFAAALLLAITLGPGLFYVLARSLAGKRREGALSSVGTFVDGLVHVFAAALGLSAVLATSVATFNAVAFFAGSISQRLSRNPRLQKRQQLLSGAGMVGLGLYLGFPAPHAQSEGSTL